jgi:AcrR family transcriptional regulator
MSNITEEYSKRRSRNKGAASKARLLSAAAAAFAAHGYHDTKVSAIVQAAGLTQPAFYLYFASKEAIFAELVDTFSAQLRQLVMAAGPLHTATPAAAADHIRANLEAVYRLLDADHQLTQVVLFHNPEADLLRDQLAELMQIQLAQAQAAGLVRAGLDLEVAALALVGMVEQLARRWLLTGAKDATALAAAHTDIALNGILRT